MQYIKHAARRARIILAVPLTLIIATLFGPGAISSALAADEPPPTGVFYISYGCDGFQVGQPTNVTPEGATIGFTYDDSPDINGEPIVPGKWYSGLSAGDHIVDLYVNGVQTSRQEFTLQGSCAGVSNFSVSCETLQLSDPTLDTPSYPWYYTLDGSQIEVGTHQLAPREQPYELMLYVNDRDSTDVDWFYIEACQPEPSPNQAPVVESQTVTAELGQTVVFTVVASDPDGDSLALTYQLASPANGAIDGVGPEYSFSADQVGTATSTVFVSDGVDVASATITFVVVDPAEVEPEPEPTPPGKGHAPPHAGKPGPPPHAGVPGPPPHAKGKGRP